MKSGLSFEEFMKPRIITCGDCGGEIHILTNKKKFGERKNSIKKNKNFWKSKFLKKKI